MEHVKILNAFVNIVIGTWIIFYVYNVYKSYKYSFLLPLVYHVIFYNLLILILLITKYFSLNIPDSFLLKKFPGSEAIITLFYSVFLIGMTFSMFIVILRFFNKSISSNTKKWLITGFIILIVIYCIKIILPHQKDAFRWIDSLQELVGDIVFVSEFILLLFLLFKGRKNPDRDKAVLTNSFACLYLSRYILIGIIIILPGSVRFFVIIGVFLLFNMIPFIWVKYFFLKYANRMLSFLDEKAILEPIYKKYNISKREQEILKLILAGKSNKEIEDLLYISINTVKNHIYNLYQKLGVQSRYQLVHLFMKTLGSARTR